MRAAKKHLTFLILTLTVMGSVLFLYRYFNLDVPLTSDAVVNSWTVEANLKFKATGAAVKASFLIPNLPPSYVTLDEYFVSHNYGVTTSRKGYNRETVWSIRRAKGMQSLYYRAIYRRSDEAFALEKPRGSVPKPDLTETERSAVEAVLTEVRTKSADIQTFAQETVKFLSHRHDGNTKILVGKVHTPERVAKAALWVLSFANIHAMIIHGFELKPAHDAKFKTYLTVYNEKEWIDIKPLTGEIGLPDRFLVWQYGDLPTYQVTSGTHPDLKIAISEAPISALSIAKIRGTEEDLNLIKFSLLQLPVNVQQMYEILMVVPLGAFIILILRNFVGWMTFGTFMPVLIALAFRETHLTLGLVLFSVIVAFGLLIRFYLDQLRLLLVPRLVLILTVVVLLMCVISILCQNLGLENGLSVALFPMVILTMTIERMCITWEERGGAFAIKSGVGSLAAAVLAYGAMHIQEVQYLFFAFPELLLILMAATLWAGQYRGYRLSELLRFKVLS